MNRLFLLLTLCTFLIACSLEQQRKIGHAPFTFGSEDFSETQVLQLPDVIQAGEPFTATVITYGSSSCTTPDGADVQIVDMVATVTPYDLVPTEGVCTADDAPHPRDIQLEFPRPGEATIQVLLRDLRDVEDVLVEQIVTVESQ